METHDWAALAKWRHESEPHDGFTQSARIPQRAGMDPGALSVGNRRGHKRDVFVKSTGEVVAWIQGGENAGQYSVLIKPPPGTRRAAKPERGDHTANLKKCKQYVASKI